jgi:membrane protein YqaA with SNARE-associated domain
MRRTDNMPYRIIEEFSGLLWIIAGVLILDHLKFIGYSFIGRGLANFFISIIISIYKKEE